MDDLRVLLIGGPPGAGKTTLCQSVGSRLGFLSTTVDDLVTTARMVTDAESHPDLHRVAGVDPIDYFTESPPEQLIADSSVLEEAMWPIVRRVIQRHVNDKSPIVFDWWLFNPDLVAEVLSGAVKSVWLHIDPEILDQRERRLTGFCDGSADPERMHANFMHRSFWRNEFVRERATALGLPVLHQPGDRSVDDLTDEVINLIGR